MSGRNVGVTPLNVARALGQAGAAGSAAIIDALEANPVDFPVLGGTFLQEALTGNYPSAAANEVLLQNTLANGNVLAVQNTSATGYSAYTARGSDGREYYATGYGNASAVAIFAGRTYVETWSGTDASRSFPKEFVFTADGTYGRSGDPANVNFIQKFTVGYQGTTFFKEVPYVNGSEQVKTATFHSGGFFALMNNVEPNAIDIPKGMAALWVDKTGGAVNFNIKSRDANNVLYKTSVAVSTAVTATASDTFTDADSATSLNGRSASPGPGTWAVLVNNWGISSNKAYRSGGSNDDYAYIDTGLSDVSVEADITLSSVRASCGLVIRGVDANNYTYCQLSRNSGGGNQTIRLFKKTGASTFVQIASASFTFTLGATYAVRAGGAGNSLYVYIDDVLVLRADDTTHVSATRQGISSFIFSTEDDGGSRWDNFKVYV